MSVAKCVIDLGKQGRAEHFQADGSDRHLPIDGGICTTGGIKCLWETNIQRGTKLLGKTRFIPRKTSVQFATWKHSFNKSTWGSASYSIDSS
jgi:hypothetical protein